MQYRPRKGYEAHLSTYHTLAFGNAQERRLAQDALTRLACATPTPDGTQLHRRTIPASNPGGSLALRMHKPDVLPPGAPIILDVHGGGWIAGSAAGDDFRAALLARKVPCIVVSVEYRLAPQHPFPAALTDCADAYCWLYTHAAELGGDPAKLALHGTSAGGNLVCGLALYLRDHNGPPVRLAAMINPALTLEKTLSRHQIQAYPFNADIPYASLPEIQYLGQLNGSQPSYYALPALCPDLTGFPPAFILASEYDPLRDEAIDFAQKLYAADVPCELVVAPRVGHGFLCVDHPLTRQFISHMADSFRNEFDWNASECVASIDRPGTSI